MLTYQRRLLPSSGLLALPVRRASEFILEAKRVRKRISNTRLPQQMDQRPEQHLLHVLDADLRLHA